MDKNTEKVCRVIYDEIKQEAENLMSGKSPSGSVGASILEHLKKAGKC